MFLLFIVVAVNAGKVEWTDSGHPIMLETDKPAEGCHENTFDSLGEDSNKSVACTHK
jgi:hypothetical protein